MFETFPEVPAWEVTEWGKSILMRHPVAGDHYTFEDDQGNVFGRCVIDIERLEDSFATNIYARVLNSTAGPNTLTLPSGVVPKQLQICYRGKHPLFVLDLSKTADRMNPVRSGDKVTVQWSGPVVQVS